MAHKESRVPVTMYLTPEEYEVLTKRAERRAKGTGRAPSRAETAREILMANLPGSR